MKVITDTIDPAEATVAAIGIEAFLSGEIKLTATIRHAAETMARTVDKLAADAVRSEPSRVPEVSFNYKAVGKLLQNTGNREQIKQFQDAFATEDHAHSAAVAAMASQIIGYLDNKFPRKERSGVVATPVEPGGVDLARFKRVWVVACNPLVILEAMARHHLARDQVQAVSDMFPTIYAAMRLGVLKAISATKAKRASWTPPRSLDLQLRVMMQTDAITPQLKAEIDSIITPPVGHPQPSTAPHEGIGETQGQRIAAFGAK